MTKDIYNSNLSIQLTIMRNSYLLFSLVFTLFILQKTVAQDQILQQSDLAEAEFHTAINPLDSNNIVLVTMHGFSDVTNSYFSIYVTKDFGASWELSPFQGKHAGILGTGDPVIAFNSDGKLILAHLIVTEDQEIKTMLSESLDGGISWSAVYTYPDEFTDKPWLAIDRTDNESTRNNIYLPTVSNDLMLISLNESYEVLSDLNVPDGNHIPSVTVSNDGDIYLCNINWSDPIDIHFQQYTDGGSTLVHSSYVTTIPDYTFNADDVSTRYNPAPYIAVDNSDGPYSGRIYIAYTGSEDIEEQYFNIFLTYSDDKGLTWSEPTVVHSDDSESIQQFYSSIYVNDRGILLIDWYDRSNYDNSNLLTDFFLGVSFDGGESFLETQLNSESMDFLTAIAAGFEFGVGDYHQLVATDNTAVSFWSDGRTNDGDLNIYFAKVDLVNPISSVIEQGIINDDIKINPLYPQPITDKINVDLELDKAFDLQYQIINLNGQLVLQGPSKKYQIGSHTIQIPLDLSSGFYLLRIEDNKGFFKNMKFVIP